MKISDEQGNRPDLLKTFKEMTARFNQPLLGTVNLLDAVEDLLCDLNLDFALVDFSPFSSIDIPGKNKDKAIVEVVPRGRQPASSGRNSRDSSSQFGVVSAPNSFYEQNQHTRNNGTVDSSKHAAAVPVFKVSPVSRYLSGEKQKNTYSGQSGIQGQALPCWPSIRESGADKKPKHVDSDTRIFITGSALQYNSSDTEQDLPNRNVSPKVSDESSLMSALEIVGRLTDELLACSPKADIRTPVTPDELRTLKQKTAEAGQTPPAEIRQFTSGSASKSSALGYRRTVGTSYGQNGQIFSNTPPANKGDPAKNKEATPLTINRIDILTNLLLVDNRYTEHHGRRPFKGSFPSAVNISDFLPIRRAAAEGRAEKQILLKPASASTENASQIDQPAGLWKLNHPHFDPAGSIDSLMIAEQLAELINDVLVNQARRHGVDLS